MSTTAVMEAPIVTGPVTLSEIHRRTGVSNGALHRAVAAGLLTPDRPVRSGVMGRPAQTLSREDAIFAILVATIAVAAGVAFVAMLRTMRANGARVDAGAGGLVIPVQGMGVAA